MKKVMENQNSFSIFFLLAISLFFSGFILANLARASSENLNSGSQFVPMPSISFFESQTYSAGTLLSGTNAENTEVYINGSSENVIYQSKTDWQINVPLNIGDNPFEIMAKDPNNNSSEAINLIITRTQKGDINGDNMIDDLDLAKLVANWETNWPVGDFNADKVIDDLDLAYLACHWGPQ